MLIVEDRYINSIVKDIVPLSILQNNPVIAGGFAVFLYNIMRDGFAETIDSENKNPQALNANNRYCNHSFTDIDCWFLEDNDIHFEFDENNILLSDLSDIKNHERFNLLVHPSLSGTSKSLTPVRNSKWANTFYYSTDTALSVKGSFTIQIIKTKPNTVKQLLDSFDLNIVKIAWHDNKLYIHPSFKKCTSTKEVCIVRKRLNTPIEKVICANRAMKHCFRNGVGLSRKTTQFIFNLYMQVLDNTSWFKIDDEISLEEGLHPTAILSDYLSDKEPDERYCKSLYNEFCSFFYDFIRTKHIKTTDLFYFLAIKDPSISSIVRNLTIFSSEPHKDNFIDIPF
jgi:hypothetical protein